MVVFDSRVDAARRLAGALARYCSRNPLVLAIPRAAVEMGRAIADELGGELDVVLVRKLRSPFSPEFAVGSIDETGWAYVAPHAASAGADQKYLEHEEPTQMETLRKRRAQYTPARPPIDPRGRIVIVVDDGLATGATMRGFGATKVEAFEQAAVAMTAVITILSASNRARPSLSSLWALAFQRSRPR